MGSAAGSRHPQIHPLGCNLPGRVGGVKDFRLGLKILDTARTPRYTRRQRSVWGREKSVRVQSKKQKFIFCGVKNWYFGVNNEKTDSQMLSPKNEEISLA